MLNRSQGFALSGINLLYGLPFTESVYWVYSVAYSRDLSRTMQHTELEPQCRGEVEQ